MAEYKPKANNGTLWPNEYKKAENHPDLRGDIYIDLQLLKDEWPKAVDGMLKISISGWKKVIAGKDCVSISSAAPYVKPAESAPAPAPAAPADFDEDIPF
jgi:hypothetical protein